MNNKPLILLVHWHVVILAAIFFALWGFFINKSGLRWPLGAGVFCLTQGMIAFPLLVYKWREIHDYENPIGFTVVAAIGSASILFMMNFLGKRQEPKLYMNWVYLSATLGIIGILFFTHELARLAELKETGDRIRGLTIASTVAIEVIAVMTYHFWDVRGTGERPTLWHFAGMLFIITGVFCLYVKRTEQIESTIPLTHQLSEIAIPD